MECICPSRPNALLVIHWFCVRTQSSWDVWWEVYRGQGLGKILWMGELTSTRDTVLNNRIICSAHISTQCLAELPISYSVEKCDRKGCAKTHGPSCGDETGMLRRLSGAGPPDTIKLTELHKIPGSHGISLIKAILKMILQQSSFYISITMYYNDRVIDLQLMAMGFR